MRCLLACAAAFLAASPAVARADEPAAPAPALSVAAARGPGRLPRSPIDPARVITGTFATEQKGSNVLLPFDVPRGTAQSA